MRNSTPSVTVQFLANLQIGYVLDEKLFSLTGGEKMSYKEAIKKAEITPISVVIIDALWHYHDFEYSKDKFPDMTFEKFVSHFWSRYGDRSAEIRFYAA